MKCGFTFLFIISLFGPQQGHCFFNSLLMKKPTAVTYPVVPMLVQYSRNAGGNGAFRSNTLPSPITAGNFLAVFCLSTTTTDTLTASDNLGNTYTSVTSATRTGAGKIQLFYAANVNAGAVTVGCNSTASTAVEVQVGEYNGVATVSPLDASGTGSGNTNNAGATVTTTVARALVVKSSILTGGGSATISDPNFVRRPDNNFDTYSDSVGPTAGSYSINDGLNGSQNWASIAASFKPKNATTTQQGLFLIGGYLYSTGTNSNAVLRSNDGANWMRVGGLPAALEDHCIVSFKNAMWVIGGDDSTSTVVSTVYKSTDGGVTWSLAGNIPAVRDGHSCVVYNGKIWVIGGTSDDTSANAKSTVYSSSDGVTWALAGNMPDTANHRRATVFNNKIWVAGGENNSVGFDSVYWSTDGATWSTSGAAALPDIRSDGAFVTHAGQMWYIGGVGTSGFHQTTVYKCGDPCASWSTATDLPHVRAYGTAASFNGAIFSVGGDDSSGYSSTNGTSWTTQFSWPYNNSQSELIEWVPMMVGP